MSELKDFAKWVLLQAFEGGDICGDDAQEYAHYIGLLSKESFDPDIHVGVINSEILSKGDEIYLYTDKLEQGVNK